MNELGILTVSLHIAMPISNGMRGKTIVLFRSHNIPESEARILARKFTTTNRELPTSRMQARWQIDPVEIELERN